jgi:hypothetical protein
MNLSVRRRSVSGCPPCKLQATSVFIQKQQSCIPPCRLCRFNKTKDDFRGDERAYNDYLERVETYIATLVSGTEAERNATEQAIKQYMATNQSTIQANEARKGAVAQETIERLTADAFRRAERSSAAATDAPGHHTVEHVRQALHHMIAGGKRVEEAKLVELRAKLIRLQARAATAHRYTGTSLSAGSAISNNGYVPCPTIFPPKSLGRSSSAPPSSSTWSVELRNRVRRAGGWKVRDALKMEAQDADLELFVAAL